MPSAQYFTAAIIAAALFSATSSASADVEILTNHLGYELNGSKQAVLLGHPGDDVTAVDLLDAATNRVIQHLPLLKIGPVDHWKDWTFWTADFTPVHTEGKFLLTCTTNHGQVRSFPFLVENHLLERYTLSDVVYYFKDQRIVGQQNKADSHLQFEDSTNPAIRLDLHGGWADATGDSGIHLSHLNFATYFNPQHGPLTTWALFECYDELKAHKDRSFGTVKRRMLDEALYGADYLCRSKNPDGSFYRSVDDNGENPEDRFVAKDSSGGLIKKTKNPNPLQDGDLSRISKNFLYEVSFRCGGGMSIAALARASTYPVSGDYSSADYLKAAQDGFAFLTKYNNYYTNDGKDNIIDDYCVLMAATELYKATKNDTYKAAADQRAKSLMSRLISSGKFTDYWRANDADLPFFHAADAGLPVVALLNYHPIADASTQFQLLDTVHREMETELRTTAEVPNPFGYARQLVQSKNGNRRTTFFFPHDAAVSPWWQGENARLGSLATAARMTAKFFTADPAFHEQLETYAANQLNWILGENPYDVCMLHGTGRNSSEYTRGPYDYIGAPGGICNGITSGLKDPHDIDFNAKTTGEDDESWRWNEQWLPHSTWFMLAVSQGAE
jgi:hypothetical protein